MTIQEYRKQKAESRTQNPEPRIQKHILIIPYLALFFNF